MQNTVLYLSSGCIPLNSSLRIQTPSGRIQICSYTSPYLYIYIYIEREREREREKPFHSNRLTYVCVCGVNYQSSIVIYYPSLCNKKTRKVRQVCQKEMSAQSFSIFYLNSRTSSESSDKEEL